MKAGEDLKAVLCDPEGKVCIKGSDKDRQIIQESLAEIEKQVDLLTLGLLKEKTKKASPEDLLFELTENLDFDAIVKWAKVLDVEVNYPATGDMWPDWEVELRQEVCEAMQEINVTPKQNSN